MKCYFQAKVSDVKYYEDHISENMKFIVKWNIF